MQWPQSRRVLLRTGTGSTFLVTFSMSELHLVHNLNSLRPKNDTIEPEDELGLMSLPNMNAPPMLGSIPGKSYSMPAMESEREPLVMEMSTSTPNLKSSLDPESLADELLSKKFIEKT